MPGDTAIFQLIIELMLERNRLAGYFSIDIAHIFCVGGTIEYFWIGTYRSAGPWESLGRPNGHRADNRLARAEWFDLKYPIVQTVLQFPD